VAASIWSGRRKFRAANGTASLHSRFSGSWPRAEDARHHSVSWNTKIQSRRTGREPLDLAARDTKRDVTDGRFKILKENRTVQNRPSLAEMAVTEFRVRCSIRRIVHRGPRRAPQRGSVIVRKQALMPDETLSCSVELYHRAVPSLQIRK